MKLQDFLEPRAVLPDLETSVRDEAMGRLVDALVAAGRIAPEQRDDVLLKLLEREASGSTGFGKGVAVPHIKHNAVNSMVAAIGISPRGIDFTALDKQPVFTVVMLMSPPDHPEEHLQAMETVFSLLQDEHFRSQLRQADDAQAVMELLGTPGEDSGSATQA